MSFRSGCTRSASCGSEEDVPDRRDGVRRGHRSGGRRGGTGPVVRSGKRPEEHRGVRGPHLGRHRSTTRRGFGRCSRSSPSFRSHSTALRSDHPGRGPRRRRGSRARSTGRAGRAARAASPGDRDVPAWSSAAEWLIEEQHARLDHDRASDRDPLGLAAGQLSVGFDRQGRRCRARRASGGPSRGARHVPDAPGGRRGGGSAGRARRCR